MNHPSLHPSRSERGIALVSAILVMLLITVLGMTFMLTAVGERSMSSGSHISRAATFAADAGVRTMQQQLSAIAQSRLDSLTQIWPGNGPIIQNPGTLFPAGAIAFNCTAPVFAATATIQFMDSTLADSAQTYDFEYAVTSDGEAGVHGRRQVVSRGTLRVSASRGSFSDYLVYTNQHTMPGGGSIWFTSNTHFDGRMHSNGEYRFAYQPTFNDLVSSVNSQAWYNNGGDPVELNANNNGTIDVPQFGGGFDRAVDPITLPNDAFGQMNAALGLNPSSTVSPSNSVINQQLGLGSSATTPPDGIHLVHTGSTVTGGLFVQGDLDQCLMNIDGSGNQVYTLIQGSQTSTITVDRVANTTSVNDGSGTTTYSGNPRGIMFVNGSVDDLRGPDRVSNTVIPAIATGTHMLVAATNDIIVQRDVTCENYTASSNVLGLFSSDGKVRVGSDAPDEMNLDAFVMAAGNNGCFTVDGYNSGEARGQFHLRGGMVTEYYGAFGTFNSTSIVTGYGRDFHYDRRGIIPPYFPTTARYVADHPVTRRMTWKEM